jgi:hypothetical protein
MVDGADEAMGRLRLEPLQPIGPEAGGIAREEDPAARPGDPGRFRQQPELIDGEGADAVLDAEGEIEGAGGEGRANGVRRQEAEGRASPEELPRQGEARARGVDPGHGPGSGDEPLENAAVAAAELEGAGVAGGPLEDEGDLGLEVAHDPRRRDSRHAGARRRASRYVYA